ncbi:hypothetical protein [Tenacibaculum xiamenense]|uniref:hypothetical protein n=1 Tax=Tenacibaculum xiamenense TaxID=1261553 RepID=UPI003894E5C0
MESIIEKLDRILGVTAALCLLVFIVYHSISTSNDLIDNGVVTKGKIFDGHYVGGKFYIKYYFYVANKKYVNERRVSTFVCDDGTKCCIGKEVKVFYSKKNPENSDVNLGKYNKYKMGKKLYEFYRDSPATIDYQE